MAPIKLILVTFVALIVTVSCVQDKSGQLNQIKANDKAKGIRHVLVNIPEVGKVRGRLARTQWSREVVYRFFDIKYGESPTGPLRFKRSIPAKPWKEVRNAFELRGSCPSLEKEALIKLAETKHKDIEDCLSLSISTKSFKSKSPVMVYIHGDFLSDGNSIEAAPGYLLEEDVVLVSISYRLGPFGFLSSMSEDIPGNAGVTDVILALEWIQKHIKTFGGDPSRVTLFGQVGGAALINVLVMSPAVPEGLFHRVIYQSGSALTPAFITDDPLSTTKAIAQYAGCNAGKVETLNGCLLNLNATTLLKAFSQYRNVSSYMSSFGGVQFVIGGPSYILPEHPGKLLVAKSFRSYPTMGGTVKNPGTYILKDIYLNYFNETIADDVYDGHGYINSIIHQTNGADPTGAWKKFAESALFTKEQFQNGSFRSLVPGLIDMCGTIAFKNPVLLAMQSNAKNLANSTYLYSFDYEGENNRYGTKEDEEPDVLPFNLGASLTDDNLYLFPWPWYAVVNSNRDVKIAKRMVALWTSFAATGKPTAPGVPDWPPMTKKTGPYLKIGQTVKVGENFLNEYSITVKETKMGYNLVNEEYFEDLELEESEDAVDEKDNKQEQEEEEEEEKEAEEEEEEEDPPKSINKVQANKNQNKLRMRLQQI